MKILTTVEHLIETGERDIASVAHDIEDLAQHLVIHLANGHTKAAVEAKADGSVAVKVTHEESTAAPAEPSAAPAESQG